MDFLWDSVRLEHVRLQYRATVRKAVKCVYTNVRELSGPPSCHVTDIIPRIAVLGPFGSKSGQPNKFQWFEKTAIQPIPTSPGAGVIGMPELSIPSTYAMRRASDIDRH